MNAKRLVLSLVLAGGLIGVPAYARAQAAPRADSPVALARKAVVEAEGNLRTAKAAAAAARAKVTATFGTANPEYAKAVEEAAKAKAAYTTARDGALAAVRATPAHKEATAGKIAAQAKIRELQGKRGQEKELEATYAENTRHTLAIQKMENEAVDDKNAKLKEARDREAESYKALEAFKPQVEEAVKADPDCVAADAAVVAAGEALTTALEAFKTASTANRPTPQPK